MKDYPEQLHEEEKHLEKTIIFIRNELEKVASETASYKKELISSSKDMLENTAPFSNDFAKLTEMVQHLSEIKTQTVAYSNMAKFEQRYRKLLNTPYFGRFDFSEDGLDIKEKIYVGLANAMDQASREVYVYDWRAPISSIFYRFEPGKACYETPLGKATGEVFLKRQYKIKNSQLQYFFDCNVRITDDILQEILAGNSSPQMRNIVETIQKEQDVIIRDTENQLLLVQGPAGSGKTSIALHRIAFLLYEGLHSNLSSNNVIIISPNDVFSQYISGVLPELGEENVLQATFDDIANNSFGNRFQLENREDWLENMIRVSHTDEGENCRKRALFKGSETFRKILDTWTDYYGRKLIPFEDVSFNGIILETGQQLKNRFLHNEIAIPMAKQLAKLENILLALTHPLKKERLQRLEQIVTKSEGRELEIKSFSRLLAIRESQVFRKRIMKFTRVDYLQIYRRLFSDAQFLSRLNRDPGIPEELVDYLSSTNDYLRQGIIRYEDYAPLLYLKLSIEGNLNIPSVKQVFIDEAQDYSPLQFHIFKLLFRNANYTILGDINQSISENKGKEIYDDILKILAKGKSIKLFLSKSYRSTREIQDFSQKLIAQDDNIQSFDRHGDPPKIIWEKTEDKMHNSIIDIIKEFSSRGFETIAVICKTQQQAEIVYSSLKKSLDLILVEPHDKYFKKGTLVVSTFMAKGLEFDAVIVYDANTDNYKNELDKRLLYIACTRALHELVICYTGEKSFFIS